MFRVLTETRVKTAVIWWAVTLLIKLAGGGDLFVGFLIVSGIWIQIYFSSLKIYFEKGTLVKHTGNIFNREQILLLKNICEVNILIITLQMPALIRIVYPDGKAVIMGMTGWQAQQIKERILRYTGKI